jgi:two-component system phosphate regulon sensor histidine kinase PhoR
MAEDKILVTDLINQVGNKALSSENSEPLIKWVLEKAPLTIEHDVSAIILSDGSNIKYYLWFNRPVNEQYLADFRAKSLWALNSLLSSGILEKDLEVIAFNEGEVDEESAEGAGGLASFHCAPLTVRGNILGAFAISSSKPDVFLVYRVNMFNVFANQVALAIDSLSAREQVARQARIIERDSINMKNAFSGMSEGLIMTDEYDKIILVNPAARRMLALDGEKSLALSEDFAWPVLSSLLKELADTDKRVASKELDLEKPYKMTLRLDATSAKDSAGKKIGVVVLLRDITREKEIDRMKTEFISIVSHELRTPLTTIRESVSQVLDGILGATTDQQREFLSICLDDIDRLTRIINDLLDISKIEAKKLDLKKQIVDITGLVRSVNTFFLPRAKDKGLSVQHNFSREPIVGYVDKDKLIQVLNNLIGNSLKFTRQGVIEVSLKDSRDTIECSVSDTGKGIAAEDIPKVFGKFQQFGRTDGPGEKGTGLGLSIAKGIVELHLGKMWVESKLGEWTKFNFTLPKYIDGPAMQGAIDKKISEAKRDFKKLSVFVIQIKDYPQLKIGFGEEDLYPFLLSVEDACKKILKGFDFLADNGSIVIASDIDKQSAVSARAQLEEILEKSIFQIKDKPIRPLFFARFSSFPEDGDNAKELLL